MEVDPIWTEVLDPVIVHKTSAEDTRGFRFLQVGSPSRGLPQKEWEIHDLSKDFISCDAIQPIHDLVVARRLSGPSFGEYVLLAKWQW